MQSLRTFKERRETRARLQQLWNGIRGTCKQCLHRLECSNMLTWRSWRDNLPAVFLILYLAHLVGNSLFTASLPSDLVSNAAAGANESSTENDSSNVPTPADRLAALGEECLVGRGGDADSFRYRDGQWFCAEGALSTATFNFESARDALRMPPTEPRATLRASLTADGGGARIVTLRGDVAICASLHLRNA
jgi:hypothetical protein